jgi:hypothetical protein
MSERFSELARPDKAAARQYVATTSVLDQLCARRALDRDDKKHNAILWLAGTRWAKAHYRAGLDPLSARDLTVEIKTAHGPKVLFASEAQTAALYEFNAALAAIPADFREVATAIVIGDRGLVEVGRKIGAYEDVKMASAVALFCLRRALKALVTHWGMVSEPDRTGRAG